ncbi:E3 ubiquitin-protein ligase Midline-1-like [Mercenaria mercenaria]|uniref:E3 ubiquitin-protein ligase Midline-1-like n=1 Tax=Mercenaria mercenaria TaxID=6596 RepID=UPI00234F14AB|nr:E3 ubiquitin-protein ligase Midline-1-like [Mercenaria mercenaria]
MAEGGGFNVSVRGSDAEFEYTCTPCAEDGSNQEALIYCPECKEYLCAACTKYHQKVSATKKHTLLEKDFQQHEHSFDTSEGAVKKRDKCATHAERDIEMYCRSHDMVYCALCIAKDHRSCTDVFEIEEAVTRFSVQPDEILVEKAESALKQMIEMKQNKDENIQTVEKQNEEIQMKVQQTKNKLIQHVEKHADETTKTVDTLHTSLIQELANERETVIKSITTLENCRQQLDFSGNFDKSEQFVKQKLQSGILSAAEILFNDTCQFESQKIICKENNVLLDQIMSATALMQVERNVVQKKSTLKVPPSVKSMSKVNVKASSDTKECNIVGICQLSDGTIILADFANRKIKRLDDQYRVRDHCDFEAVPRGICCTGINEVAVKLGNNKVQFVSVGAQMLKTFQFDIKGGINIGFVRFADTLWSYNGNGADIYCKSGTLLKTHKNDSSGKQLFKSTSSTRVFPVASNKSYVYVSDLENRVVCLDTSENVNMMLTEPKLKQISCMHIQLWYFVCGRIVIA